VVTIGSRAFNEAGNLTRVTLPGGLKALNQAIFWDCESLTTVNLPVKTRRTIQGWGYTSGF
jgi:hypothetical protein